MTFREGRVTIYRTFGSIRRVPVIAWKPESGVIASDESSTERFRVLVSRGSVARPLALSKNDAKRTR
jgi:hypothetical protein